MILVTGASGRVGKEICRILTANGEAYKAGFHSAPPSGTTSPGADAAEAVPLDFLDRESLRRALRGVETVMYVAPPVPEMAQMTENLLAASRESAVRAIVKISAYGEEEGSTSLLGTWHSASDRLLRESGIPSTILCAMPFMQNVLFIAKAMIQPLGAIMLPCGQGRVSHVDSRDVAAAAASVLSAPEGHAGRRYVITGPEAISYGHAAEIISEAAGRPVKYRDITEEEARAIMGRINLPAPLLEAKLVSFRLEKAGARSFVSEDFMSITGRPATSFAEFVAEHRAAFNGG